MEVKMKVASDGQTAGGVALTMWSAASCLACPTGGQDWANEGGSVAVMEEMGTGSTLGGGGGGALLSVLIVAAVIVCGRSRLQGARAYLRLGPKCSG